MKNITNNGRWVNVELPTGKLELPIDGATGTIADSGKLSVKVTPDLRIGVRTYMVSDPLTVEEIKSILAPLGLEFRMFSKDMGTSPVFDEDGNIQESSDRLLQLSGLKEPESGIRYYHTGGFVFRSHASGVFCEDTVCAPYLEKEVRKAVNIRITQANNWMNQNLPSFKRAVKPTAEMAIRVYELAQRSRTQIVPVKLGDTVFARKCSGQKSGSGGAWATWEEFGQMAIGEPVADNSNKFIDDVTLPVTFDQGPAVLFTASGDGIGKRGRLYHSVLYIVE